MPRLQFSRCTAKPYRFLPPFSGAEYALLLVIATVEVTPAEQAEISRAIISSGCRFAVCFGHQCTAWHDAIDWASVVDAKESARLVMTTWHDDETPEEVAHFFAQNTSFEEFSAVNFGVFVLGSDPQLEARIQRTLAHLVPRRHGGGET